MHETSDAFHAARLSAAPLGMDDFTELCVMHKDPRVMEMLGGIRSDAETRRYVADNVDHWGRYGFGVWALRDHEGRFAGRAGLRHLDVGGIDEVELLYSFTSDFWGRGMATEIAQALLDIGFGKFGMPDIIAYTLVEHHASRHVMEKVGFQFECEREFKEVPCVFYRIRSPVGGR